LSTKNTETENTETFWGQPYDFLLARARELAEDERVARRSPVSRAEHQAQEVVNAWAVNIKATPRNALIIWTETDGSFAHDSRGAHRFAV
jgi:hypothetical protein